MSSQINPHMSVPKLICQKDICQKQSQKNKGIFSCNLQKDLDDYFITDCKGCIGKQKDQSINYCQINFEDLCLQLRIHRNGEKEILAQVGEIERKLEQIVQNAMQQINRAQENISKIGKTIRSMCLFQQDSDIEQCFKNNEQASLDQVIKMIKQLRDKITIIQDGQQNNHQQIRLNKDKLNIIYDNGTIIIDDFLKNKLSQMSQLFNCFEQQVSQININDYNFIEEQNQTINSNYQQIGEIDNLNLKKIYNLRFNRSNNLFAFGSSNLDRNKANCIEIWKIENNQIKKIQRLQQYPDVTALCFNYQDDSLFTGGLDSKLIYWLPSPDGTYKEALFKQKIDVKGQINCIEINSKSNILTVGSEELSIFINKKNELELITKHQYQVKNLSYSNCKQIIIAQCIIANEDKIQLFYIQQREITYEIIHLGEVIQAQQIQPITKIRFMFINLLNQVNLFKLENNRVQKIENNSIQKLNLIQKCGIGYCSINNTFNLLAFSQNINNETITQILKINEQNQVTLLQSIQQIGQGLYFSNNGQIFVIWNGDSLVVFKDKSQTI